MSLDALRSGAGTDIWHSVVGDSYHCG